MTRLYNNYKKGLPNLNGKVIAITGTTSGTGFIAAKTCAELEADAVLLLNRKSSRSAASLSKLKEAVPDGNFVPVECDLQDFKSVRRAAAEIASRHEELYCLANNAGIMATPDEATGDGYDTQMQTNHLSHFLLTAELFPLLRAGAEKHGDARIVNHSSLAREYTPNDGLEEKYFQKNGGKLGGDERIMMGGGPFHRYFQSKLANSVFTYALHEKLRASSSSKDSKIRAVCAHPGGSNTNLDNHLSYGRVTNLALKALMPVMTQSAEDGSVGLIKAMIDPDAKSGVLYGPWSKCRKAGAMSGAAVPNPPKPYEVDPEAMAMLWRTSEEAAGVKFVI